MIGDFFSATQYWEMHFRVKNPVGQENQFLRSGFFLRWKCGAILLKGFFQGACKMHVMAQFCAQSNNYVSTRSWRKEVGEERILLKTSM